MKIQTSMHTKIKFVMYAHMTRSQMLRRTMCNGAEESASYTRQNSLTKITSCPSSPLMSDIYHHCLPDGAPLSKLYQTYKKNLEEKSSQIVFFAFQKKTLASQIRGFASCFNFSTTESFSYFIILFP